jgi:hypothetical protein
MNIPKNIFFFWDTLDIPNEAKLNIDNYRNNCKDYNVYVLNNDSINKYKDEFKELTKLFHSATIAALKADIIRLIFLYKEGGMWLDINTTLVDLNGIDKLFERYKDYDFVTTIQPDYKNDLKTSCLISKPNSKLAYDSIIKITENLKKHYEAEKKSTQYIQYNFFLWVTPVVFYQLLEYKYDDNYRKKINNEFIKKDNNIISLKSKKIKEYKCGLMDVRKILKFYGCNMTHHHGINSNKHWSKIQKHQKLFK